MAQQPWQIKIVVKIVSRMEEDLQVRVESEDWTERESRMKIIVALAQMTTLCNGVLIIILIEETHKEVDIMPTSCSPLTIIVIGIGIGIEEVMLGKRRVLIGIICEGE